MVAPAKLAQRFVAQINAHDVNAVAALLTPDHRLVDSLGAVVQGPEALRDGWRRYFRMVPDYRIEVEGVFADGPQVVLVGIARGTYTAEGTLDAENTWSTPAAWRVLIRGELVAEWQVYADNEPIRRCIARASA